MPRWFFLLFFPAIAIAQGDVTNERVLAEADTGENWFLKGGSFRGDHYSPLEEINEETVGNLGLACAVRSKAQPITADTEVYLADTLGELKSFLAHARVVIMGGSFNRTGGHNLIEPASLGCAIITGPSDDNIAEDIALLGPGKGILQVEDWDACWHEIGRLIEQPESAEALGREARTRIARQPDIVQQYLAEITPYLTDRD